MQVDREFDDGAEHNSWHAGILQTRLHEKVTDSWNSQEDVSDAERVLQMSQQLQELIENRYKVVTVRIVCQKETRLHGKMCVLCVPVYLPLKLLFVT
jgi:hypothetical protein